MPDIFISYGRKESKNFASRLHDQLAARGYDVWFDQNDIPLGVDYQEQIDDGIIRSNNFVFIIAPHAVASPYCLKEIVLAAKYHKRIIPILHVESDFDQMHPTIQKLNWIYAREHCDMSIPQADWKSIDDFNKALEGLITIVESHKEYVEQHTHLLLKALEWEANQQKTAFLLVGNERLAAEKWLLQREFTEQATHQDLSNINLKIQAPCRPSDLHATYICESRKNAENLLCDVFISYAQTEKDLRNQIVRTLAQCNITTWSPQSDVRTGQDWVKTVEEGIEQADNFVFFITPYTATNDFFIKCLHHALKYHKRIIPLLVQPTPVSQLPIELVDLTYIDITDNQNTDDLRNDIDDLLNEINTDYTYYHQHKLLLVQALKWQKQQRNPSILLRGYNLQTAEIWLKLGKTREHYPPLPIHEEFIQESLAKVGQLATEVFISYSRNDSDIARKLNNELQLYGKTTWFDQESILEGTDFGEEIRKGIAVSDNFVFLISPKSVTSPYCEDEVSYASSLGKRIITILIEDIDPKKLKNDKGEIVPLHPDLAKVQWIDFRKDFSKSLGLLLRTLETDREYVQQHTKWGEQAINWAEKGKSTDLLLRGNEYALAEEWLKKALQPDEKGELKNPKATDLQIEYILASQKAIEEEKQERQKTFNRLRFLSIGLIIGLVAALTSIIFAVRQRDEAHNKALVAVINQLAALARQVQTDNPALALRIAERAYQLQPLMSVRRVIKDILADNSFYMNLLGHEQEVNTIDVSPNGRLIVTGSDDKTIQLWNQYGQQLHILQLHNDKVNSVKFAPNGRYIVSGSSDGTVKYWETDGTIFGNIDLGDKKVSSIAISPDSKKVVVCADITANNNLTDTINVYSDFGELQEEIVGHRGGTMVAIFSPSGRYIASVGRDSTAHIIDTKENKIVVVGGDNIGLFYDIAFSPDEKYILTGGQDYVARIWDLKGNEIQTFKGHTNHISAVAFSSDQKLIATGSHDNTVKLWNLKGEVIKNFTMYKAGIKDMTFSADCNYLYTACADDIAHIIDLRGNSIQNFHNEEVSMQKAVFHPLFLKGLKNIPYTNWQEVLNSLAGTPVIISVEEQTGLYAWKNDNKPQLFNSLKDITSIQISPNNEYILVTSSDTRLYLLDTQGKIIQNFEIPPNEAITAVCFSPDSKYIAAANYEKNIRIWSVGGSKLNFVPLGAANWAVAMSFMPDGKSLIIGGLDNTIRQVDFNGKILQQWKGHDGSIFSVDVSSDGKYLLSGSQDATAKLWDFRGNLLQNFKGHTESITEVAFSPDNRQVLTASLDRTARLWEIYGEESQVFKHEGAVSSAMFSVDGKAVLTVSKDKAKIWYADWAEFLKADRVAKFSLAELARVGVGIEFDEFFAQTSPKELIASAEFYTENYTNDNTEELLIDKTSFAKDYINSIQELYSAKRQAKEQKRLENAKRLYQKGLKLLQDTAITKLADLNPQLLIRAKLGLASVQSRLGEKITGQNLVGLKLSTNEEILSFIDFFANRLQKSTNQADSTANLESLNAMYDSLLQRITTQEDFYKYGKLFQQKAEDATFANEIIRNQTVAIRLYEKAHSLNNDESLRSVLAALYISIANYRNFEKNFAEAETLSKKALTYDIDHLDAQVPLATAYLFAGKFDKAKAIYDLYKNKNYNGVPLRMMFLGNIEAIASQGVTCADFQKAQALLK
jgi:WD40 repeat protein